MKKNIFLLCIVFALFIFGASVKAEGEYKENNCGHLASVTLPGNEGQLGVWSTSDPATVKTDTGSLQIDGRFFLMADSSFDLEGVDPNNTWGCFFPLVMCHLRIVLMS